MAHRPAWLRLPIRSIPPNHDGDVSTLADYDQSGEIEGLSYSYDSDSRLTEVTNSVHSSEVQYNTYDHDGQLTNTSSSGFGSGGTSYGFDSNGNISGSGDSVGDGNTQLSANGYSYTFDADGNMITQTDSSGNVTTYAWDNRNRLTSATLKNSSGVTQQVVTYTYDAMNQLIGESVTPYSGGVEGTTTTQRFVYDPATGEMQLAFNGSGNLTDRYLWGPLADEILADEKATSLSYGGTVYWMAHNAQGSVTDVIDDFDVVDHIAYNAWGGIASQTNSEYAPLFGYDGEYTDPATGMQWHLNRWYLPWAQRWASEDPTFPEFGTNPFEAFGNSPANLIDPSGLAEVGTGVFACWGWQKGDWFWDSLQPVHYFIEIDGKGFGFFQTNNNAAGAGKVRDDDLQLYPDTDPGKVQPGKFYCTKQEIKLDDATFDIDKYRQGVRDEIAATQQNPPNYLIGWFDCSDWVDLVEAHGARVSRRP